MIALGLFADSSVGLLHALGFAADIKRRCLVNREAAGRVAESLGLDQEQVRGAVRLLEAHPTLSPERLALVAMLDPGLDDQDIAEIFGRSERWAQLVRERADEIRSEEPVAEDLEYLDSGLQKGDPSPSEIAEMASQFRRSPARRPEGTGRVRIRMYSWRGDAFLCQGTE